MMHLIGGLNTGAVCSLEIGAAYMVRLGKPGAATVKSQLGQPTSVKDHWLA